MMRRVTRACVAPVGMVVAGCMTVSPVLGPAQVGPGFEYSVGQATQVFAAPLPTVETALRSAMEDLRIRQSPSRHTAGSVSVEGTTPDDRHVVVTLEPAPGATRVKTRIGWVGDEPLSRALMDRLGIRLGGLPPSAAKVEPTAAPATNPASSREAASNSPAIRDQIDAGFRDSPVP